MRVFEGDSADSVWSAAASALLCDDQSSFQQSQHGNTREILHAAFVIRDPRQRWVSARLPALNPAFALAEVVWMLNGRNDAAFPNFWNPSLPKYQGDGEIYAGAYGHRLRASFGVDQLRRGYNALAADPTSRQVVLQIWDATTDLPLSDGTSSARDVPCNVTSLLKLRDGRLHWTQIIRSNDLFLGVPYNFVQFTMLQEIMAGWLGAELGPYTQLSDSLHLYETDIQSLLASTAADATATRSAPFNDDYATSAAAFKTLSDFMDGVREKVSICPGALEEEVERLAIRESYREVGRVVLADALRRAGDHAAAQRVIRACSESPLTRLYDRWTIRWDAARGGEDTATQP